MTNNGSRRFCLNATKLPFRTVAACPRPPPAPTTANTPQLPRISLHRVWLRDSCLESVRRQSSCVLRCQFGLHLSISFVFCFFFPSSQILRLRRNMSAGVQPPLPSDAVAPSPPTPTARSEILSAAETGHLDHFQWAGSPAAKMALTPPPFSNSRWLKWR